MPIASISWRETSFLVVDLETTGLDANVDRIIAIGAVQVDHCVLKLKTAWSTLVKCDPPAVFRPESTRLHGILPWQLDGPTVAREADALAELATRAAGRVLVGHMCSFVDRPFLDAAWQRLHGTPFPATWLDTAVLAARFDDNPSVTVPMPRCHGLQRLPLLLQRYGLPEGAEHDALGDAISASQLLMVLANKAQDLGLTLGEVVGSKESWKLEVGS